MYHVMSCNNVHRNNIKDHSFVWFGSFVVRALPWRHSYLHVMLPLFTVNESKILLGKTSLWCPSQAIPGVGPHPHTPGHHGWLRHPIPYPSQVITEAMRGLEHPTPSHHLLQINVSPAPGFATKLTPFFHRRKNPCEQTGNIFIKIIFRIHKLCDEKHGIELGWANLIVCS